MVGRGTLVLVTTRYPLALLLVASVLPAGCSSPAGPLPQPPLIVDRVQVDSLELVKDAPAPSSTGLGVRVLGILGDGCTELLPPITQEREGSVTRVTILRQRPRDAICIEIAKLFDQVVPLVGEYPPGRYIVRVNTAELAFSVP